MLNAMYLLDSCMLHCWFVVNSDIHIHKQQLHHCVCCEQRNVENVVVISQRTAAVVARCDCSD